MTDFVPAHEPDDLRGHLSDRLGEVVGELTRLQGGQISRVYAFDAGARRYVVRVAPPSHSETFAKEAWLVQELLPADVPVPALVYVGHVGELSMAISEFAPGARVDELDGAGQVAVAPALLATLDRIHACGVGDDAPAGSIDEHGRGQATSWRAHLAAVREEQSEGTFYGRWHRLFTEGILERDLFDAAYARMAALLPYCPEERRLVHGDYGFSNVLAQEGRVTAVLDWANAIYGDPLFDLAWLIAFPSAVDYAALARAHLTARAPGEPHVEARLRCYQYWIGLESLRYSARRGRRDFYDWRAAQLRELLASPVPEER